MLQHCCFRWLLWIVSFNGKSIFNRLLDNGCSNLNDFNDRLHEFWFRSNAEKINPLTHLWAPACKKRTKLLPILAYFCPNGLFPQMWGEMSKIGQFFARFCQPPGKIFRIQKQIKKILFRLGSTRAWRLNLCAAQFPHYNFDPVDGLS